MDQCRGHAPGFDTIRIVLAVGVLLIHSIELTHHGRAYDLIFGPLVGVRNFIVPAFFSLSGFLVAGSMVRLASLRTFFIFRALRIFPALAVEITLSALVLGSIVTLLPLDEYYRNPEFATYFGNIVGQIQYTLPGVFTDKARNNGDWVNGSLWTVPSEMLCYLTLGAFMLLGIAQNKRTMAVASFCAMVSLAAIAVWTGKSWIGVAHWTTIIICFYVGVAFYLFRYSIRSDLRLVAIALIGWAIAVYAHSPASIFLGPICCTYLVCVWGMKKLPRNPLYFTGDYSYGIYLYGFPIQQTLNWVSYNSLGWVENFGLAFACTFGIAAASWHLIEKPMLALRNRFPPPARVSVRQIERI
jgi:peptidoglycan/LPS O-acetylase OafA/YrhL